jgi:HEPN domain-containing protein
MGVTVTPHKLVNREWIEKQKGIRYTADNPLIVSDYEAEECIKISEEIYEIVKSKLKR